MSIKELRAVTGMTQEQFAGHFHIPVRTLQKWERGGSTPPSYVLELLEKVIQFEFLSANTDDRQQED